MGRALLRCEGGILADHGGDMNLIHGRLGLLLAPTAPLWTGTVNAWDADTFALTVNTSTGSLNTNMTGLAVAWNGRYLRIKTVNAGTSVLTLAETEASFESANPPGYLQCPLSFSPLPVFRC